MWKLSLWQLFQGFYLLTLQYFASLVLQSHHMILRKLATWCIIVASQFLMSLGCWCSHVDSATQTSGMQKSHIFTATTEVREELWSGPLCWQSLKVKEQCLLCVRCHNHFPTCMTSNNTHDRVFPTWQSVSIWQCFLPNCFPLSDKVTVVPPDKVVPVWQSGSEKVSYLTKSQWFLSNKVVPPDKVFLIWQSGSKVLPMWQSGSYLTKCFLFDKVLLTSVFDKMFLISVSDKVFPICLRDIMLRFWLLMHALEKHSWQKWMYLIGWFSQQACTLKELHQQQKVFGKERVKHYTTMTCLKLFSFIVSVRVSCFSEPASLPRSWKKSSPTRGFFIVVALTWRRSYHRRWAVTTQT